MFLSSFFSPWNSVSPWLWGLGSPALTVSIVVSLLRCLKMIRPFRNKLTFICFMAVTVKLHDFVKTSARVGGLCSQAKSSARKFRAKYTEDKKGLKEMARNCLFKLPPKLSMTPVCYRNSICLSVLFLFKPFCFNSWQTWAEPGSKGGIKVSPPQESPTDRPDQRLREAKAYFIYRVRLMKEIISKGHCVWTALVNVGQRV